MASPRAANYPQIFDGFCYGGIFGTRPMQGCNWYWNCLEGELWEKLRIAQDDYRPRNWVVPELSTNPANTNGANIEPGKTLFYQFQVKPGSYLYAASFCVFGDDLSQSKFSVKVKESFTDLGLYDRPAACSGIRGGTTLDPFNTIRPPVELLPEPRLILAPAQVHVELSNDATPGDQESAFSCQLLLMFAEPKRMV